MQSDGLIVCAQAVSWVDLQICHSFISHIPVMSLATIWDSALVCFGKFVFVCRLDVIEKVRVCYRY